MIGGMMTMGREPKKKAIDTIIGLLVPSAIHQTITNCIIEEPNNENN
jgi:hypothetical protein